jgi:hypothetical protein
MVIKAKTTLADATKQHNNLLKHKEAGSWPKFCLSKVPDSSNELQIFDLAD